MLVTYLITVYNKEKYLKNVIKSIKEIEGDFEKEYIFVNDGSTDNSLEILKQETQGWENIKIISHDNCGPAKSTNVGIEIAKGDFVQFIDADDILTKDSTSLSLEYLNKFSCDVVGSRRGTYDIHTLKTKGPAKPINLPNPILITDPLYILLVHRVSKKDDQFLKTKPRVTEIRGIGSTGSVVSLDLLKKIKGCDETLFVQDYSLSLRCSLKTGFVYLHRPICFSPTEYDGTHVSQNKEVFLKCQSITAVYNLFKDNPQIAERYYPLVYYSLRSCLWKINRELKFLPKYLFAQYVKIFGHNFSRDELLSLYEHELDKLHKRLDAAA